MRLILVALGCAVAVALTGCAAGQTTQADTQGASVNGANGDLGEIAIRNALFAHPEQGDVYREGDDVPLLVTISNNTDETVELVAVRTPVAQQVRIEGYTTIPSGYVVSSLNDADNVLYRDVTASPSPSPAASPAPPAPPQIPSRPVGTSIDGGELLIVLTDLTRELRPGLVYPVTFRFREAGEITLPVPLSRPEGTIGEPEAGLEEP